MANTPNDDDDDYDDEHNDEVNYEVRLSSAISQTSVGDSARIRCAAGHDIFRALLLENSLKNMHFLVTAK